MHIGMIIRVSKCKAMSVNACGGSSLLGSNLLKVQKEEKNSLYKKHKRIKIMKRDGLHV